MKYLEHAWNVPGNTRFVASLMKYSSDKYRAVFMSKKPYSEVEVVPIFSYLGETPFVAFELMLGRSAAIRDFMISVYDLIDLKCSFEEGKSKYDLPAIDYDYFSNSISGAVKMFDAVGSNLDSVFPIVQHYRGEDNSEFTGNIGSIMYVDNAGITRLAFYSNGGFLKTEAAQELKKSCLAVAMLFDRCQEGSWKSILSEDNPEYVVDSGVGGCMVLKKIDQNEKRD